MAFDISAPPDVIADLPKEAKRIWINAWNTGFRAAKGDEAGREAAAFKIAWAVVGRKFEQNADGKWKARETKRAAATETHGEAVPFRTFMPFCRKRIDDPLFAAKKIVYAPVFVPDQADTQADIPTESDIENAIHDYMQKSQVVDIMHAGGFGGDIVECAISREGDPDFPVVGTPYVGIKTPDDVWARIVNNELTGISPEGNWEREPIPGGGGVSFLKNTRIDKISIVDLAANRSPFVGFKCADCRDEEDEDMKKSGHVKPGQKAAEGVADPAATGADTGAPQDPMSQAMADAGVKPLAWPDAIALYTAKFNGEDAPRIAGMLLGRWGEGPNQEIMLPADLDPIDAAMQVIDEGKALLKEEPLLRPEGKATAMKHIEKAVAAAVKSILGEDGLAALRGGAKKTKAAGSTDDASGTTATATTDPDLGEKLDRLTAAIENLGKPAKAVAKPKAKVDEDEEDEDQDAGRQASGANDDEDEDDADDEDESDAKSGGGASLDDVLAAVTGLADRVDAIESGKTVPMKRAAGGKSKSARGERGDEDGQDGPRKRWVSTFTGQETSQERKRPHLNKATRERWGMESNGK